MTDQESIKLLDERFAQLPESIQQAITSADVEAHLRKLSDMNQLHLDQWQELETEVMMALMGIKPVAELKQNIKNNVHVDDAVAEKLSQDISTVVFAPVRDELERFLSHPSAKPKEGEPIQDLSAEILKRGDNPGLAQTPVAATPQPAAPPAVVEPPKPTVARAEAPQSYTPGQTSAARKDVHADPYREAPDVS